MLLILIKLAWRNILRNKRRTLIASTAISIGLAALIFLDALMIGMFENMIKTATNSFIGDAQIHRQGYRDTLEVSMTIEQPDKVTANLAKEANVQHFTRRTFVMGMIASAANKSAISLVGIQPHTEKHLSQIDDAITEGVFFEGTNTQDIVIGSKLAENLEVTLGDKVVVTVVQANTGEYFTEGFRVSGIYYFADAAMNGGMAFIRIRKAQQMLAIGNRIHQIAIKFTSTSYAQNRELPFWGNYSKHGNEALSWTDILPQLPKVFEISKYSKYIMGAILFGVVAFGIINTLFMSLYDRMFEFGVLRAVGTRSFGMARIMLFEAAVLAIISIIFGGVLGYALVVIFAHFGLDFTGNEMMGVTLQEFIYPVIKIEQFITYPVSVFIFTIIAGLYPAWHLARMKPVDAMRRSF